MRIPNNGHPGNGCVSLVLVSHSDAIARGVAELVRQVAGPDVPVIAVGGASGGALGTDGSRVLAALRETAGGPGAVVLMDIGSAVLAVRAALHELSDAERSFVKAADAPLVEGAIAAAVSASTGAALADVRQAAETARNVAKL